MHRIVVLCLLIATVIFTTPAFCSEIKELAKDGFSGGYDQVLCVDGLKVFKTIMYTGSGVAVASSQLYEEKNGKVVPATCK